MILNLDADLREHAIRGTPMFPCEVYHYNVCADRGWEVPWHWHRELELALVLHGAMVMEFGGQYHIVREGEGVFINSNTLHFSYIPAGGTCETVTFVLFPEIITGNPDSVIEHKYIRPLVESRRISGIHLTPDTPWQKDIIDQIHGAYRAHQGRAFGYEFFVRDALSRAFYHIVTGMQDIIGQEQIDETADTKRIKSMINFVRQHYTETLEPAAIAKSAGISERECFRCFKKMIGQTPVTYLQQYRISVAAELLAHTDESVTEICFAVGFLDTSYFSKIFKRYMHMTPREFRNQSKQEIPGKGIERDME